MGLELVSNPIYLQGVDRMLKFYEVDSNYIAYLKNFDDQIPDFNYTKFNKFVCGIVLNIGSFNYFAPVSSFNQQQRTNFLIRDNGVPISSIRFCFMFPVPPQMITLKNLSNEPQSYKDLVNAEIRYCNNNRSAILKQALQVYKIGSNRNIPLAKTCCDFKLLEAKYDDFIQQYITTQPMLGELATTTPDEN